MTDFELAKATDVQALNPDTVGDRDSFFRFVEALIEDRTKADELENSEPERYRLGGANDWQNSSIAAYLECALAGAVAQQSWAPVPVRRGAIWRCSFGWARSTNSPTFAWSLVRCSARLMRQ